MRNPNGHPDRIKGDVIPHPQRTLEISSCIQCPFCMIDTSVVTTHNNEFCNFTVPYWVKKLDAHDIIPVWCPLPSHSSQRDIEQLKTALVEVLDTGFESSERDLELVLDRITVWERGELHKKQGNKP